MKKGNLILLLLISMLLCVPKVNALDTEKNISDTDTIEEVKYFKIVTVLNGDTVMAMNGELPATYTIEISEEEFNGMSAEPKDSSTINNGSFSLTSRITKSGNYYVYSAETVWSNFPTVRSYDTIGFGFYASVKPKVMADFEQYYCTSESGCTSQTAGYYYTNTSSGLAATYHLPSGTLTTLKQTLTTTMEKTNSSSTIISQRCVASYGHSNSSSVTYSQAKDFNIDVSGLNYGSAASSYSVSTTTITWSGSW